MKKTIILSFVIAITSFSIAKAQCLTTSYGVSQSWSMPYNVYNSVYHNYYGYDVVHSTRYTDHGHGYFEVVLQRGNIFVRVNIDAHGRIHRRVVNTYNPIVNHSCNTHCGFHSTYYKTHQHNFHKNVYVYNVSDHKHHNNGHNGYTHGNKHNYQSRGNGNNYGNNNNPGRANGNAYGKNNNPGRGNAYGHNKGNNGNAYGHSNGNNGQGRGNNRVEPANNRNSNSRTAIAYNDSRSTKSSYPSRRQ